MLTSEYLKSVSRSDQFKSFPREQRLAIAIQGLASEIGSVVSAIKKESLREGGALSSRLAKSELIEELGDVLWYIFVVSEMDDVGVRENVLFSDIAALHREIGNDDERAKHIRTVLSEEVAQTFLVKANDYLAQSDRTFGEYQQIAKLTARTKPHTLLTVCAAVMSQLGAQAMRHLLPDVEKQLNTQLEDRDLRVILSELSWHVAAIATLYKIDLDFVVKSNAEKTRLREDDPDPTPLHDEGMKDGERFPRHLVIDIKPDSDEVSQMYWNGEKLGDPLRDNSFEPDGYRFHDVMHLANLAHLGWSPVLRKLMKLKRRSVFTKDDVDDGGRAAVVEEAIVKIIHAEAFRRAAALNPDAKPAELDLFPDDEEVPFGLIKQIRQLAFGHEVYDNKAWEWKDAIRSGYRLFNEIRKVKTGRIVIDLETRSIRMEPLPEV